MPDPITCTPKMLPRDLWVPAAARAIAVNPLNNAPAHQLSMVIPSFHPTQEHLAVVIAKYWSIGGVHLTVGFLDGPESALRVRILSHMNAWAATAHVRFSESADTPDVRIARTAGDGYWSYLGVDIGSIPHDEPTMNLDSFTMRTPESEYHRVVRHETGHTLGFPHEHMRRELVARIDSAKAIQFYGETQGWNEQTVIAQVLTPIEEAQLLATPQADPDSIMCYQIPGSITKDGEPILGGTDIDPLDAAFAASIYPKPAMAAAA